MDRRNRESADYDEAVTLELDPRGFAILAGFVALAVTEVNKLLRARDQLLADIASAALGTPRQTIL